MSDSKQRTAGDFAVVGIHQGNVLLEANEWDPRIGSYWAVTLYLAPDQAIQLAEELTLCADGT